MHMPPAVGVLVLLVIAATGVLARSTIVRVACWTLAMPPLAIGALALWQGGIAEPFSAKQLLVFCALAFLPVLGCGTGQLLIWRRRCGHACQAGGSTGHGPRI